MSDRPTPAESFAAGLRGNSVRAWMKAVGFAIAAIAPLVVMYYPLFSEVRTVYENGHYATLAFAFLGSVLFYYWYVYDLLGAEL